eukprot:scaffold45681_cov199-Amphora_coffeaeformis.AAC.1
MDGTNHGYGQGAPRVRHVLGQIGNAVVGDIIATFQQLTHGRQGIRGGVASKTGHVQSGTKGPSTAL